VIYSASWATLIAVILVIVWLHRRKHEREEKTAHENGKEEEKITE
jgi:Na+/H+ antiporter NhaD/arsenite permease-like protein